MQNQPFAEKPLAIREIKTPDPELSGLRIRHRHADRIALHRIAHAAGNHVEKLFQLQLRDHRIVDVQQQLQPLATLPQRNLGLLPLGDVQRLLQILVRLQRKLIGEQKNQPGDVVELRQRHDRNFPQCLAKLPFVGANFL